MIQLKPKLFCLVGIFALVFFTPANWSEWHRSYVFVFCLHLPFTHTHTCIMWVSNTECLLCHNIFTPFSLKIVLINQFCLFLLAVFLFFLITCHNFDFARIRFFSMIIFTYFVVCIDNNAINSFFFKYTYHWLIQTHTLIQERWHVHSPMRGDKICYWNFKNGNFVTIYLSDSVRDIIFTSYVWLLCERRMSSSECECLYCVHWLCCFLRINCVLYKLWLNI